MQIRFDLYYMFIRILLVSLTILVKYKINHYPIQTNFKAVKYLRLDISFEGVPLVSFLFPKKILIGIII